MLNVRLTVFIPAVMTILTLASPASAAVDYRDAGRFVHAPLEIEQNGKTYRLKSTTWKHERDTEGTDILSDQKQAKVAVLKTGDGVIESVISYRLDRKEKASLENSSALFFGDGHLKALTQCEERAEFEKVGRVCITATPKLCRDLRTGQGVNPDDLAGLESFETRALASILTLRGSDHQLDNMVKSGNRLGLKSGLQTTKGQLIALSRQVARELGKPVPENGPRKPEESNEMARTVLEAMLPKLKTACIDAKF